MKNLKQCILQPSFSVFFKNQKCPHSNFLWSIVTTYKTNKNKPFEVDFYYIKLLDRDFLVSHQ